MHKEIEENFDVDEFYQKEGFIPLNVQNEAIEWENKITQNK